MQQNVIRPQVEPKVHSRKCFARTDRRNTGYARRVARSKRKERWL